MNVIVIGGGASGLMAAITAAKGGHSVTLLERQARVGRKLLSTGNGRCNLTNLNMGLPYYHGQDAAFIRPAFEALSLDATLDFFHGLGLLTTAEDNGRVYPYSDQAGSVVDVLRFAADAAGVTTRAGFEVTGLKKTKRGFTVLSAEEKKAANRQLWIGGLCCGAALAIASNFQQAGLVAGTDAGKAGFITALYVVLVPVFGLFLKRKVSVPTWIAVVLSVVVVSLAVSAEPLQATREKTMISASRRAISFFIFPFSFPVWVHWVSCSFSVP